jgi:hypothetical protein
VFKIVKADTYKWPVTVRLPVDGGKFETSTFDVTFKRLSAQEVADLRTSLFRDDADANAAAQGLVVGWSGVENNDGAMPFSHEALTEVLQISGVAPAIVAAFFESVIGAPRKN